MLEIFKKKLEVLQLIPPCGRTLTEEAGVNVSNAQRQLHVKEELDVGTHLAGVLWLQ